MNLLELREQLQENLISFLDGASGCEFHQTNVSQWVIDQVCEIVVETFDNAFFSPAPNTLDTTP